MSPGEKAHYRPHKYLEANSILSILVPDRNLALDKEISHQHPHLVKYKLVHIIQGTQAHSSRLQEMILKDLAVQIALRVGFHCLIIIYREIRNKEDIKSEWRVRQ